MLSIQTPRELLAAMQKLQLGLRAAACVHRCQPRLGGHDLVASAWSERGGWRRNGALCRGRNVRRHAAHAAEIAVMANVIALKPDEAELRSAQEQ